MTLNNLFRKKKKGSFIPLITEDELSRLQKMERYTYTETILWGNRIAVPDSSSFLGSVNEIFIDEIYKFSLNDTSGCIIDCGANIGDRKSVV